MSQGYRNNTALSNTLVCNEKKEMRERGIWVGMRRKENCICVIAAWDRIMTSPPFKALMIPLVMFCHHPNMDWD
jgi:hypothetical protein